MAKLVPPETAARFGSAQATLDAAGAAADAAEHRDMVFEAVTDPRWGSLLAALILFAFPTFILGLISPYAVRLLVVDVDRAGNTAGRLYFVSTIGSALGTLATSFYFVLWFQMNTIIFILSGALLLFGFVSWVAARRG